MRYDGGYLYRQINSNFQTHGENANPAAVVKVTRHKIPISYWDFVERSLITTESGITDISVATKHIAYDRGEQEVWVAYVQNGKLKVKSSRATEDITGFEWIDASIDNYSASSCAIAFNSVVHRTAHGKQEFLTEEYPWVFWVQDGSLKAWQIYSNSLPTEIAAANVTDVSVVRGPSAPLGSWDLGLTAFFIMSGSLYYRQLINGEWYDAEQVTAGPTGTYVKIAAYRTWDYRVCVQALLSDNSLYNIFTYTEGIGVRSTEHIEVSVSANVTLSGIEYYSTQETEHIEVGASAVVQLIYGLSCIPVSVQNVEDEEENWGTTIEVIFDYPVHSDGLTAAMFTLVDSSGNNYVCDSFNISGGGTGRKLTLTFDDFNLAGLATNVTLSYTKPASGGLMSPAVQTDSFSETFVPINLEPPQVDPPTFASASTNSSGTEIYLVLTEQVTNVDFSNMNGNFTVGLYEYTYVPNGELQRGARSIAEVITFDRSVDLSGAVTSNIKQDGGAFSLEVDSNG